MTLEAYVEKMKNEYSDVLVFDHVLEVKAVADYELEVLGAPYGGHRFGRDEHKEYFSSNTDFMIGVGDSRPVVYYHGLTDRNTPSLMPEQIGKAIVSRIDAAGVWFRVILDKASRFARRIWEAAQEKKAVASSGSLPHLVRKRNNGEILKWPIGELSLWDWDGNRSKAPANQLATVRLPMKALYENAEIELPESFLESGELKKELAQEEECEIQKRQIIIVRK